MRKINTFWNWFQDNNQTIKNLINETPLNQKHISFWISKNLSYYCKEIDFLIVFPKKGNTKSELIITANGNPDYFSPVINLVDNAPQLRNWKFTAFIQPTERIEEIMNDLDKPYIFQDIILKTSDLKFLALDYDDEKSKLDLIVYLNNYTLHCSNKTLEQAIFIITDVLEHYSMKKNVNFVQLAQTDDNEDGIVYLYDSQLYSYDLNLLTKAKK
jgi:hypothetical protein